MTIRYQVLSILLVSSIGSSIASFTNQELMGSAFIEALRAGTIVTVGVLTFQAGTTISCWFVANKLAKYDNDANIEPKRVILALRLQEISAYIDSLTLTEHVAAA